MRRKLWVLFVAVAAVALLGGCGSGGKDLGPLQDSISAVASGWRTLNVSRIDPFVSDSYYFNGLGRADYLATLQLSFNDMDTVTIRGTDVDAQGDYAWVNMRYTAFMYVDVAAVGEPEHIRRESVSGTLRQLYIKDFDGEWRLAEEYLRSAYVIRNTPSLYGLSVLDGDRFRAGSTYNVYGTADAGSSRYRATMGVAEIPGAISVSDAEFGWSVVDFEGTVTFSNLADGPYAFTYVGQTDDPTYSHDMVGRVVRASYIEIYGAAAPATGKSATPAAARGTLAPLRPRHVVTTKVR